MFSVFDHYSAHLQKNKKIQTHHNWNWIDCQTKMGIDLGATPPNHEKYFPSILFMTLIYLLTKFHDLMI